MRRIVTLLLLIVALATAWAQMPRPTEGWISVPGIEGHEWGVYYFRKSVTVATVPATMRVRVSGDNRYKLWVNGTMVCLGPARSDLAHWNCDEVDLAPYMHTGTNVLAAQVWNDGPYRPEANMTYRTAFVVQAAEPAAEPLKTDASWLCTRDEGYSPLAVRVPGYYAAGPGECIDMRRAVTDWQAPDATLTGWHTAEVVSAVTPVGVSGSWGTYPGWLVRRSPLPQRYLRPQRFAQVRRATGVKATDKFVQGGQTVTIPAHSQAELILDQRRLTNAYPWLDYSGGQGASITVGYAEAFYDSAMRKGNRDEIEGRHFVGRTDSIIAAGGTARQRFTTLAWRTFRYVVLRVRTAGEALSLHDVGSTATGYPFELKAGVTTGQADLDSIFSIGWRTAGLCAVETYMDCPYYEQLQYFGDSRIQALVNLYMTDDERLVKSCLDMADWSRQADGVTQSRYPSTLPQWIQPYALHYIYALHDYMLYGRDMQFLREKLMSVRTVLNYFSRYQLPDGRVKDLPGWNFTDWVDGRDEWRDGVALPGPDGCNSVMDLQLLLAYQMAADLERNLGMKAYAELYDSCAAQLGATVHRCYWRPERGLLSDRAVGGDVFSQHACALAILTGVVTGDEARRVALAIEGDTTLAPASIYFKFYTHQAMAQGGLADHYLSWLGKWRENMAKGLTTWAETSDVEGTRSDCHAWGASPNVELLRTVLGIASDAPAYAHVSLTPHLGTLRRASGHVPHPQGTISVSYEVRGTELHATMTLPQGVTGTLSWHGATRALHAGTQRIVIANT